MAPSLAADLADGALAFARSHGYSLLDRPMVALRSDPAVQAGRLAATVMTWMMPAGNLHFETVRPPHSLAEAAED